ncbi:hypothetical protein ACOSQ3_031772 [Xanthoceras sorbifolium]
MLCTSPCKRVSRQTIYHYRTSTLQATLVGHSVGTSLSGPCISFRLQYNLLMLYNKLKTHWCLTFWFGSVHSIPGSRKKIQMSYKLSRKKLRKKTLDGKTLRDNTPMCGRLTDSTNSTPIELANCPSLNLPHTNGVLDVRQAGEGMHHVPGLVEAPVTNMSEVWEVLQTGSSSRAVGSTNANEHSSRSHCIHCVMVRGENLLNGECTKSKLWLVDLAGSERVAKTEVQGERLKETQNINRSLSALGDVISALATKSPHIPFRNSKLTHLLQDSLGGDSKTLMFVQISPNENDLSETLCSLNFASRVRGIELGPAKKQFDTAELLRYKQMIEKSKQDLKSKDLQSKKMEETIYGLDSKIKDRDLKIKTLQDKVKELESQLLIERKLARQHVDTKIAEQQMKQQQEEQQITAPLRPPLANRVLGINKNFNEPASTIMIKEQGNPTKSLAENNNYKPPVLLPPTDNSVKQINLIEKENNHPEMVEQPRLLPKRTGRASICTAARRIPVAPAPRRNSLIPLPSAPTSTQLPQASLPLPPLCQDDEKEDIEEWLPEQIACSSPKGIRSGGQKLMNSILRRSIHKKMQMKSPMQQHLRRVGVNVGMEKVRVSIGSRGRMAHRVLLGSGRRTGSKEIQQKQHSRKEKERGWNIAGTVGRT